MLKHQFVPQMKNLLFVLLSIAAIGAYASRPLTAGHRGSHVGIENSVESFTKGALAGYDFLETDLRVTADTVFVCSHDEDLQRLGGVPLKIADTRLDDLRQVELKQTRFGRDYTGRICTAQEYLDICREHNVLPLIELKWSTGINNNDFSNIPRLIEFIEANGMRDKCIILTSMKPCLEYIRENYPDIRLQFLTGQYWPNHFDWCVEKGIDVDIQKGNFTADDVNRFHEKGLKVNVWVTNDPDQRDMFADWGCDFITTDSLPPL